MKHVPYLVERRQVPNHGASPAYATRTLASQRPLPAPSFLDHHRHRHPPHRHRLRRLFNRFHQRHPRTIIIVAIFETIFTATTAS
jgi:hypothetical protein